jgi:hypothetical protein
MLGFAVACAAILSAATAQAAPEMNKAVVRSVRGSANYSTDRGANWKTLKVGTSLNQGSVLRTAPGSQVDLYLNENGPVVRVKEGTTLGLDRLTVDRAGGTDVIETQLDLRSGRILGNVHRLAAASKYEVKTPTGVAGIRGTRYDISADGRVSVIEGQVVVVYIVDGAASTATVNAGQTANPPTTRGGQVTVNPITEADRVRIMGDMPPDRDVVGITPISPTTIVTVKPINEALQEGDPAKLETPILPD